MKISQGRLSRWIRASIFGPVEKSSIQEVIMEMTVKKNPQALDHNTNRREKVRQSRLTETPTDRITEKK